MRLAVVFFNLLAFSSGALAIWCDNGINLGGATCANGLDLLCCNDHKAGIKTNWKVDCQGGPSCDGGTLMCCAK
ncbi:hypothetical protein PZA11_006438 [Diplocarpon coronariae]|uniref:Hydrophobin n=1 Tax=Diplocarpon coronariae TaxID=2795749 RepID=A0A218ZB08_9HELO|nr:hypothetical protein JHW43_004972 [Diplocarpon mali]OWP05217.1 hypothetical protein B2J93_7959 [Marssonina coronariae]